MSRLHRKAWVPRAMSRTQFLKGYQAALRAAGVAEETLRRRTYKSLRRFLPTAAKAMRFSEETAIVVGDWQEKPTGEGSSSVRATFPMHRRYAGGMVEPAGEHKRRVADLLIQLACEAVGNEPICFRRGPTLGPM